MKRTMTLALMMAILFCTNICSAIDLESPGAKKVTVRSEIQRGNEAAWYIDTNDDNLLNIVTRLSLVFRKERQQNTDSPGFLLGASFGAWLKLSMELKLLGGQARQGTYDSAYKYTILYFKDFRKLQKEMEIDDRTLVDIIGAKYDALGPRIHDWEAKAKDAQEK